MTMVLDSAAYALDEETEDERQAALAELLADPRPGLYRNIPADAYHASDLISRSTLEAFHSGDSLAQIRWDLDHRPAPSDAMLLGTALHYAVLEPHEFLARVVAAPPDIDLRRKDDKARWSEFQAEHADKIILRGTVDVGGQFVGKFDMVRHMADAIMAHPFGQAILPAITERELTIVWRHPQTVTTARGRLDAYVGDLGLILDVKTIHSNNAHVRQSRIKDGLHRQGAFYCRLARELGLEVSAFVCLFVQSAPPWEVVPVRLSETALAIGWREMEAAWLAIDSDWSTSNWRGHAADLIEEGLPEWYERRELFTAMMA
jgi:exodeoxyribonuclease VIII